MAKPTNKIEHILIINLETQQEIWLLLTFRGLIVKFSFGLKTFMKI